MKLKINGFDTKIDFNNENINILVIKDTRCFSHIIETINNIINGEESTEIFLLDNEDNELNMSKEMYLVIDLFNIEYNIMLLTLCLLLFISSLSIQFPSSNSLLNLSLSTSAISLESIEDFSNKLRISSLFILSIVDSFTYISPLSSILSKYITSLLKHCFIITSFPFFFSCF